MTTITQYRVDRIGKKDKREHLGTYVSPEIAMHHQPADWGSYQPEHREWFAQGLHLYAVEVNPD